MGQSRMASFVEAVVNVLIGYSINFTANALVLPAMGFNITLAQNLALGVIFTVISVARSYAIRRWFNGRLAGFSERLASRLSKALEPPKFLG